LSDSGGTRYDWLHYIPLVQRKPGALRNGAPFADMPEALQRLRSGLLRQTSGGRVMAQVLTIVPTAGLDTVMVAIESAMESSPPSGRVSVEHVINVLGRFNAPPFAPREFDHKKQKEVTKQRKTYTDSQPTTAASASTLAHDSRGAVAQFFFGVGHIGPNALSSALNLRFDQVFSSSRHILFNELTSFILICHGLAAQGAYAQYSTSDPAPPGFHRDMLFSLQPRTLTARSPSPPQLPWVEISAVGLR